jgi:hypothetical protein
MARWLWLGLSVLFAAGLTHVAWAQGGGRFDGQYIGELTLTSVVTGDCTEPPLGAVYPLTVVGGEVRFAYVPRFATTLVGRVDGNGMFRATARLKRGTAQMTGRIRGDTVIAEIASPSCKYRFQTRN